jgi:hypothetical protein
MGMGMARDGPMEGRACTTSLLGPTTSPPRRQTGQVDHQTLARLSVLIGPCFPNLALRRSARTPPVSAV